MITFPGELVAHIQSIAIAYAAWRGAAATLADLLAQSMATPARLDEIRRLLHSKPLQSALAARDVLLWVGHDGQLRLVDAQPVSHRAAVLRVQHHPGQHACRFCLMTEAQRLDPELDPERDVRGEVVVGSFVHPRCAVAWSRLRAQVLARETTT